MKKEVLYRICNKCEKEFVAPKIKFWSMYKCEECYEGITPNEDKVSNKREHEIDLINIETDAKDKLGQAEHSERAESRISEQKVVETAAQDIIQDIIVTTIDSVPARQIEMTLGIVSYQAPKQIAPPEITDGLFELKKQAHHINANAIIGYSANQVSSGSVGGFYTLHIGTAVRLKEE